MKIDLNELKYYYDAIDKEDLKEYDIKGFKDFQDYVVVNIIDNLEYDFGINFEDYVDINRFKKEV